MTADARQRAAHRRLGRPAVRAARRSTCFTVVTRAAGWCRATRCCWASRESLAGMALRLSVTATPRASASTRAIRRWPGRSGTARPGSRADVFSDTTGGLNRAGEIVLMVPNEHEPLTLADAVAYWLRVRLLRAGARPADLPGSRRGSTIVEVAAHRRRPCGPSTPRPRPPRCSAAPTAAPARSSRSAFPPVLPRRHGETVRVTDRDGVGGMDRGGGLLPLRAGRTTTSSGTRRPASSGSGRGSGTPTASVRQHGRIPRDGAEIAVTGYRYGGGVGRQRRRADADRAAHVGARTSPVRQPAAGGRRGGRGNRCGGEGARPADPAHRAAGRHRRRFRAADAGVLDRGGPGPLPAVGDRRAARCGCWWCRRCAPIRAATLLDDFALAAPLMRTDHRPSGRAPAWSAPRSRWGRPYYQGVSVAALVHAPPGRPAALVRQRAVDELTRYIHPLTGGADGAGWLFDADLNAAADRPAAGDRRGHRPGRRGAAVRVRPAHRATARRRPRRASGWTRIRCSCPDRTGWWCGDRTAPGGTRAGAGA